MKKILPFFLILRPRQWIKNLFVFAPLIFSGNWLIRSALINSLSAFVFFCIVSSFIYIINDIHDINRDKLHPIKSKQRPLANGSIRANEAYFLATMLLLFFFFSVLLGLKFFFILIFYILLNILYTFKLKNEPVLDIFSIAISFVLRVISGSYAINLPVSSWMCITTLCLALYLASIKRRQELLNIGSKGRVVLNNYSLILIERYAEVSATGALVFYSIFCISFQERLAFTVPIVLFGLFRYWYIVEALSKGESPTDVIFEDKPLLIILFLWVLCCLLILRT